MVFLTLLACAYGDALTQGYGRLDGTLVAVFMPGDKSVELPSPDHIVLHIRMRNELYRVELNTLADRGPEPGVQMQAVEGNTFFGGAFSEGWHQNVSLDYNQNFGMTPADLVPQQDNVVEWLEVGRQVSVYGQSAGGARGHTLHLIHRTRSGRDGAIVINPADAKPIYLIFAFAGQNF